MAGRKVAPWLVAPALLLVSAAAAAHDFNPGALRLIEVRDGQFEVAWSEPVDSFGVPDGIRVTYPSQCHVNGGELSCGSEGLHGTIAFDGVVRPRTRIVLAVRWQDGRTFDTLVTRENPRITLGASAPSSPWRWIQLGSEHVFTGFDHLAFVVGLFLVVGTRWRRLWTTITAFTAAHSSTLALAALGWVQVPRAPVEATIAASVLLVASEATHDRPTATRRFPWLVAFIFGLVHGLGFAGALSEIGLPRRSLGVSLVSFNVGVELAQLLVVSALWFLVRALPRVERARTAVCYVLGGVGAYWFFDRAYWVLNR